jgi:selenocysteine-specific translation elongation factor
VRKCQLANGRAVEFVNVPGHYEFSKNAIQVLSLSGLVFLVGALNWG